jgi:hypothetical protein
MVPENFLAYELDSINDEMGRTNFRSLTIIPDSGVDVILNKSRMELCFSYAKFNEDINFEDCYKKRYSSGLKKLFKGIDEARDHLRKIKNLSLVVKSEGRVEKKRVFKMLKKVMDIIFRHMNERNVALIFRDLLPKESFFQTAKLASNLRPFPGGFSSIAVAEQSRGGFIPGPRHLARTYQDLYGIFSDHIHRTINRLFYRSNPIDYFPFQGLLGPRVLTPSGPI